MKKEECDCLKTEAAHSLVKPKELMEAINDQLICTTVNKQSENGQNHIQQENQNYLFSERNTVYSNMLHKNEVLIIDWRTF